MVVCGRFVSVLFSISLFQISFAMPFDQELHNAITSGCGYSVMTITRNAEIISIDAKNATYAPFRSLGGNAIEAVFQKIKSKLHNISKPVLVVFNEYFFARELLHFNDFCNKLKIIKERSKETPKAIYYVNFLHEMHPGTRCDYDQLITYSQGVSDIFSQNPLDRGSDFSVTACDKSFKTVSPGKRLFANETLVVFNGVVISTYKKSTYYHEADQVLDTIDGKNPEALTYLYGKGEDEVASDLSKEYKAVADVLHSLVYTDICWDVVRRIRLARETIINRDFSHRASVITEAATKMKTLFGEDNNIPIHLFKVHIIQSDSVNIHPHVSDFPDGQILIHSDSRTFSVNKILYPKHLRQRLECLDKKMPRPVTSANSSVANTIIVAKDDEIKRSFASIMHQFPREEELYEFTNDDTKVKFWLSLTEIK